MFRHCFQYFILDEMTFSVWFHSRVDLKYSAYAPWSKLWIAPNWNIDFRLKISSIAIVSVFWKFLSEVYIGKYYSPADFHQHDMVEPSTSKLIKYLTNHWASGIRHMVCGFIAFHHRLQSWTGWWNIFKQSIDNLENLIVYIRRNISPLGIYLFSRFNLVFNTWAEQSVTRNCKQNFLRVFLSAPLVEDASVERYL